jgi:exodeoxyribonuclease VII small subunit
MPRTTAPKPREMPVPSSYEQAIAELERLVLSLEDGQLPLDSLLESYQRGTQLLGFCKGHLEQVEHQVKLLEDGQLRPLAGAGEP